MMQNKLFPDKPYVIICEGRDEWNFLIRYIAYLTKNNPVFPDCFNIMGRDPAAHDNELQKTTRYAGARRKLYKEKLT